MKNFESELDREGVERRIRGYAMVQRRTQFVSIVILQGPLELLRSDLRSLVDKSTALVFFSLTLFPMDYDRNDALLHWIFRQTQGDAWFRPNEENISSGVALRVSDGAFSLSVCSQPSAHNTQPLNFAYSPTRRPLSSPSKRPWLLSTLSSP